MCTPPRCRKWVACALVGRTRARRRHQRSPPARALADTRRDARAPSLHRPPRRYHITERDDYKKYNKLCGMVTKLVAVLQVRRGGAVRVPACL